MATPGEAADELRGIAHAFEEAPVRVLKDMHTVTSAVGHQVEALAKVYVPVDTGTLQESIGTIVTDEGDTVTASIGTEVDYAIYVEFGTRNMLPEPYLGPALDFYEDIYADALGAILVPESHR